MKRLVILLAFAIGFTAIAIGQNMSQSSDHGFFQTQDLKWMDGPASLPKGAKVALLEGNPAQEGPFTMRLQLPDGFKIQPHSHPAVEHVTVISGTFNLGMGEKFDTSGGRALPAGAFAFMPPGMKHFAWAKGETVVQVHGIGPWKINYVNPSDDPRNQK
jgi:quercetin dioxygenase-like cupin family protein